MANATFTLGSLDLNDGVSFRLAGPPKFGAAAVETREVAGVWNSRQVGGEVRELVEDRYPLKVLGADIDAILANLAELREQLPHPGGLASNSVTYGRPGAASSRTATVLYCPQAALPDDEMIRRCAEGRFDLVLIREAFWRGSEITLLDESVLTAPCLTTLGTLVGDYPAPLDLTFAANTTDFHSLIAGALAPSSSLAWANLYKEAEGLTWYSGSVSAGPTSGASGGASKKNQSTSYAIAEIGNTRFYDEGSYLPLLRAAILDTAKSGTFKTMSRIGWSGDYDEVDLDEGSVTGTGADGFRYTPFKPVRLPLANAESTSGLCNLWVGMKSSSASAGDEAALDSVALIPTTWGHIGVHASAYDRDFAAVKFGADGSVILDDLEHYGYVVAPGPIVAPPGLARLAIVAETVAAAATCSLKLTATYTPRYAGV